MESVIVMMSTYNGERYLRTQIESIINQKNVKVELFVRDDGSTDRTIDILNEYQNNQLLKWYSGDNLKPARSFMDLLNSVPLTADYYAFSDQDDYWLPEKLFYAIERLKISGSNRPALYYGTQKLVDSNLNEIKHNKVKYVSKTMKQSIISSGCTGCTMCFNKELLNILRKVKFKSALMHDNWIHKVCTAFNGDLIFDNTPYILYRQHDNNVIGARSTVYSRFKRHLNTLFNNRCYRSQSIIDLLDAYGNVMPDENRRICILVANYHTGLNRFKILFDKDFRLGYWRLDLLFKGAVLLGVF